MSDWEQFRADVPWFLKPGQSAVVGEGRPWSRGSIAELPELSALLRSATVTPVSIADDTYELLAWGPPNDRRGWMCRPPEDLDGYRVPAIHARFWTLCGGIVETFVEPETWWMNQNEVLTVDATRHRVADAISAYEWIWREAGLDVPINPDDYYAIAVEANANLTLAHRDHGNLLLFAPDHDFDGVTPLAGCPQWSLLTIDDVPDIATWIEVCAAAWRHR